MLSQDLDQLTAFVPQYLHRGEFELTAGGSVSWYVDDRELLLNDTGIKIAGRILNQLLPPEVQILAGPATAGIITVRAVLQTTDRRLLRPRRQQGQRSCESSSAALWLDCAPCRSLPEAVLGV